MTLLTIDKKISIMNIESVRDTNISQGENSMKITCSKCGADFDTQQTGVTTCPYCGCEQFVSAPSQSGDEFFGNTPEYQPVRPTYQPVMPTYHAAFASDEKANKAVKNLFSFAVLLLIIGGLRFITGLININGLVDISEAANGISYSVTYQTLKTYVALGYTEIVMHVAIVACASAVVGLVSKVRRAKFPIADESIFESYKKAFIASCVMLAVLVVYLIVEICCLSVAFDIQRIFGEDGFSAATSAGSFVWTVLLFVSGIFCLVYSLKLSKKQN